MRTMYFLVAIFLGVLWLLALLIPPQLRAFLLEPEWWNFYLRPLELLVVMCLTSGLVSLLFKRLILSASKLWTQVAVGLVAPLTGHPIFTALVVILGTAVGRSGDPGTTSEFFGLLAVIPFSSLLIVAKALYVVVPMGLLSLWMMKKIAREQSITHATT